MSLQGKSSFNYGIEITANNRSIDFVIASGGPTKLATLNLGSYTLSGLATEIVRAMQVADPINTYTVTYNRGLGGGANSLSISTSGSYLSLLFATGPRAASTAAFVMGFINFDYIGLTTYDSDNSAGVVLLPEYIGYSYLGPEFMRQVFGALNISARGDKEAIVWQVQKFFQIEFRFEPQAKVETEWVDFMTWAIQQKPLEFTPNINTPDVFYDCTLEATEADSKGLGYKMTEMLPDFPFNFRTGTLKFRQKVS